LRRFHVTLCPRHTFVRFIGPKHATVTFVEREDHPRVFGLVSGEVDAAILRAVRRLRIAADGSDDENLVIPNNRTRM